jgi:MFS family permease
MRLAYPQVVARIGPANTWLIGCLVASSGLAMVLISSQIAWLVVCAAIQGVGLSVVLPASNSMATRATSRENRLIGFALLVGSAQAAILAAPLLLGMVSAVTDLATTLLVTSAIAALFALAVRALTARFGKSMPVTST